MRSYLFLGLFLLLVSCNSKDKYYRELNEEQIKLQVILPEKEEQKYSVRVFPSKEISEIKGAVNNQMLYQCDSCFYLQTGKMKQYASYTEPISSGVGGCYEYIVFFDKELSGAQSFVFDDRFYTKKQYSVNLQKEN